MDRINFIQIIKLRSFWPIDKRKGNYYLPSGERLSAYVRTLIDSQMQLDSLAIASDGNFYSSVFYQGNGNAGYTIMVPFMGNESCSWVEQEKRIEYLMGEIMGRVP